MTTNEKIQQLKQSTSHPLRSTTAATAFASGARAALEGRPSECTWGGKVVKEAYAAGYAAAKEA